MPIDREVADARTEVSNYVCPGTSRGAARGSKMTPDSVSRPTADHRVGKTFYMAVKGREVTDDAARAASKHPLRNSPSRDWFALY